MPKRFDRDHVTNQLLKSTSATPGYAGVLPRVFPYRVRVALNDALVYVSRMTDVMESSLGELPLWFALTGHPATRDGRVTLWLSVAAADYLLGEGFISEVEATIRGT